MQRNVASDTASGTLLGFTATRSRLSGAFGARAAPVAVFAAAATWCVGRGIDHRFISFSDGVYMYAASEAAAHGAHVLYHTVALSLPPGALLGAAFLWKLSPHIETVRLALAALSVLTSLLAYRAARTLFALDPWPAGFAAAVAITGPVQAQFVGLEGETVLTPLALGLALAIERRRLAATSAVLALGFFFKLTWAPFFLAGVVSVALRDGKRSAAKAGISASLAAAGLYALASGAFGWSFHDLLAQLALAEAHSDLQLDLIPGLAAVVLALWWPLLLLARDGLRETGRTTLLLMGAGAISGLFMLKQGTFFNVLAPLEPFLAITGVAGAVALWRSGRRRRRAVVVVCAIAIAAHAASLSSATLTRALPLPLGAAVVNVRNERNVDRIASAIDAHSGRHQPVLVNPFFALAAARREPVHAADWFILRALQRYCGAAPWKARHCGDWARIKALARSGRIPVVSVDTNVLRFDAAFAKETNVPLMQRVLNIKAPPINFSLYARSGSG